MGGLRVCGQLRQMFVQCAQGACVLVSRGMGMIWNGIGGVSIGMYGEVGAVWTIRDSMPKLCDSRRGVPSV